ncbi:hypothetical protein S83_043539, partial [Arachis hypogaea]
LGKGVVEALSTMIREAVVDGITTVLPKFVETVGSSSKIESHSVKLSDIAPAVTPPSDSLKRFLDANPAIKNYILERSFLQAVHGFITIITIQIWMKMTCHMEVLIPDDHCMGTRETLLTIMPGKPIIGDKIVLSSKQKCSGTMKYIKGNFMGDLGFLHEIFVPIHLNDHWFLIVVNLLYGTVRYMDSFKRCTSMIERKRVIDDVLTYLEKFVSDKNFQETPSHKNLQFSKYKFSEPTVPQQKANSNDCGIWVAEWMILNHYWGVNKPW